MEEYKKKVLIADDDDNLRAILSDKLKISGFDVQDVNNGESCLNTALEWHPDVILLDVMMPKMTGWETLDRLREDTWGKNARIIMLTSLEDVSMIARAMEKGTFAYLIKTNISLDKIIEQVRDVVR